MITRGTIGLTLLATASLLPAQQLVTAPNLPSWAAAVGDADGDGYDDYCIPFSGNWQLRSGPTGAVLPWFSRPSAGGTTITGVGDVNADGAADIGYAYGTGTSAHLEIVSGIDGSTLWDWPMTSPFVIGGADFNADGCADVVATSNDLSVVTMTVRSGRTGTQLAQDSYATGTGTKSWQIAGDLNGDGYSDLGVFSSGFGVTYGNVLLGPSLSSSTPLPFNVVNFHGDVNGNGTSDYHAASLSGSTDIFDGNGALLHTFAGSMYSYIPLGGIGDVDGDGYADLSLHASGTTPIAIKSGATFADLPGVLIHPNSQPVGDLDGDGRSNIQGASTTYVWSDPLLPIASKMRARGRSGTTSTGRRPHIVTRGHAGLGHTAWLDVRGVQPNGLTVLAIGASVDVDLAPQGAPGNRLYQTVDAVWVIPTNSQGLAKYSFVMPTDPSLLHLTITAQAAAFDPAANALALVTSNAIDITPND